MTSRQALFLCYFSLNVTSVHVSFQMALSNLVRGNELELAVSVGIVLNDSSGVFHLAIELLARKCERLKKWCLT